MRRGESGRGRAAHHRGSGILCRPLLCFAPSRRLLVGAPLVGARLGTRCCGIRDILERRYKPAPLSASHTGRTHDLDQPRAGSVLSWRSLRHAPDVGRRRSTLVYHTVLPLGCEHGSLARRGCAGDPFQWSRRLAVVSCTPTPGVWACHLPLMSGGSRWHASRCFATSTDPGCECVSERIPINKSFSRPLVSSGFRHAIWLVAVLIAADTATRLL